MIIVCEPQCTGFEHAEFNAALLAVIETAFPAKRIRMLAEKEHLDLVRRKLETHSTDGVEYAPIQIPPRRWLNHQRLHLEFQLCRYVFQTAAAADAREVIFSSVTSAGLIAIKVLLREFRRIKCTVIPHSALESVLRRRPSLKPFDFRSYLELPFWFHFAFLHWNTSRIRYLVLGESIREHLCMRFPKLEKITCSIDHPYFYREPADFIPYANGTMKFSSLGVGVRDKGIDLVFKLAEEVQSIKTRYLPEFVHIGPMGSKSSALHNGSVRLPSAGSPLSREDYDNHVNSIDYALLLNRPASYRVSASGTLFDAFSHLKPIVALRNPFFEYYFRTIGDIGYLCDTYRELKGTVLGILDDGPLERYNHQREAMLRGREKINLPALGRRLLDIWEH